MAPPGAPAKPSQVGWTPLLWQGRCPDVWSLCRLVLAGSGNQDVSGRCSGNGLPGRADTSPLAGKVPGYLEREMGSATEALWLLPVPETVSFCSSHSHLCRLVGTIRKPRSLLYFLRQLFISFLKPPFIIMSGDFKF